MLVAVWLLLGCSVDKAGFSPGTGGDGGGPGRGGTGVAGRGGGSGGAGRDAATPSDDRPGGGDPLADGRSDDPVDLSPDAPALPTGAACGNDGNCISGFCTDGFCCESRCDTTCTACSIVKTGASNGLCRPAFANTPCGQAGCVGSTLTPAALCNGRGGCSMRAPQPCPSGLTCSTATTCHTRCTTPADCVAGLACDVATGGCGPPKRMDGQACDPAMSGADCMSGFCVDRICCDMACSGPCRSCTVARTGQPDGRCAPVSAGMPDPLCPRQEPSTCGRDGTCDGAGACRRHPDGTRCGVGCCKRGPGDARLCTLTCQQGACQEPKPPDNGTACPILDCCCPNSAPDGSARCVSTFECPQGCR